MARLILLSVVMLLSCGPARKAAWESPQPAPEPVVAAPPEVGLAARAAQAWENRGDRQSLEMAISLWENLATRTPADAALLANLSRAYFLLADGHMAPAGENGESLQIYDKGITAGENAMLAVSSEFAERVRAGGTVESALAAIPRQGQAAMYWYAANLGRFVAADVTTAAIYKGRLLAVMDRVLAIDPTFFYAAAHRFLGALYAKVPAFLGGDLDRSKHHFEQALQIEPMYLDTKVLYAEFYAPKVADRDLFQRLLIEVTEADPNALPNLLPEQRMAQRRARLLLDNPGAVF